MLRILPPIVTSQILVVFEICRFFMIFLKKNFKNLILKSFQNVEDLNPVIGICEGTLRGLQILPLNSVAYILVVFEI